VVEARREGQYLHCVVRRAVLEAYAAELLHRVGSNPTNLASRKSR
jgi:hypothetical protein